MEERKKEKVLRHFNSFHIATPKLRMQNCKMSNIFHIVMHATPSYKQLILGSEQPFFETYFFLHFSLRLSGNNHSRVISMGKFGPTTSDFGYDFWCKKTPLKHHRTVHWKRGLNANVTIVIHFPPRTSSSTRWNQSVNLGRPQNWARGAQNYPKNGPKWPKMAKNAPK